MTKQKVYKISITKNKFGKVSSVILKHEGELDEQMVRIGINHLLENGKIKRIQIQKSLYLERKARVEKFFASKRKKGVTTPVSNLDFITDVIGNH